MILVANDLNIDKKEEYPTAGSSQTIALAA